MTRDQETERDLRAWLAGPLDELPDRFLDAALDEVEATRQRSRGSPGIGRGRGLTIAAAAVLVVVGLAVLRPTIPGAGGTPTQRPSPSAQPNPSARPTAAETRVAAPGFAAPFAITVPPDWSSGFTDAHRAGTFAGSSQDGFWGVNLYAGVRLYSDPCHPSAGFTTPGEFATPADLAAGLATLPGLTVSIPNAYISPGHSGVVVDFQYVGDGVGCELPDKGVQVFATNLTDHDLGINGGFQQRWFITNVHGSVIVIEAYAASTALAYKMPLLQPIVDSITFN